jgi:hypothetical protein
MWHILLFTEIAMHVFFGLVLVWFRYFTIPYFETALRYDPGVDDLTILFFRHRGNIILFSPELTRVEYLMVCVGLTSMC